MTARIFLKLIFGLFCLIGVALVLTDLLVSRVAESTYIESLTSSLESKARIAALQPELLDQSRVRVIAKSAQARVTLVAQDGAVLADSEADPDAMENHRKRPELREALSGHMGSSIRQSATLGIKFLYVAVPVPSGALRLAVPLSEVNREVDTIRWKMLQSTGLAFVPAILIAAFFARGISRRLSGIIAHAGELARGNFHARLADTDRGEFGLLGRKLNETSEKLERTVHQLQSEHTELEKLERVRKDFVINVSHELRTPLASIQGYTETLMDGALEDPDNNIRFLGIIRHNAERLARLTSDLLTLSRIEMKTQDFQFALYRVNDLIEGVLDTVRPIADKKHIHLAQEYGPPETEVFCDSEALYQILSNLLDNAVKYTPQDGVITVGVRATSSDQNVELFVRDTGMGIPAEDLPRLFERFYRVDKARSRELGGTGLGLAIVKHLVRAHGGEVRVESHIGQGSTFCFTLPVDYVPAAETQELHPQFTGS